MTMYSGSTVVNPAPPARWGQAVVRPKPPGWLAGAADLLLTWSERARVRRQLMEFDDHLLRDVGITHAEAMAEASKPFWCA